MDSRKRDQPAYSVFLESVLEGPLKQLMLIGLDLE